MRVKRALVSVSDKSGLEKFVKGLHGFGVEIISTGGTAKNIREAGVPVVDISDYTGYPEMLDGRVKTLHPKIHAGLLSLRDKDEHTEVMKKNGIPYIDMVVVNLYPFRETISRKGVSLEEAIENIDIGGPSMLRSAAKNYRSVAVISSPGQYTSVLDELRANEGSLSESTLRSFANEVFRLTAEYDMHISRYLSGETSGSSAKGEDKLEIQLGKVFDLRYGENPHQAGCFYMDKNAGNFGLSCSEQFQGKQLSFNNIMDLDSAISMSYGFERPAAAIVKHNNPCGAAESDNISRAYIDALDCDRMSAFGSIVALNRPIDEDVAKTILDESDFVECIVAPDITKPALDVFSVKKNLRVLKLAREMAVRPGEKDMKKVLGGMLVQDRDEGSIGVKDLKIVTEAGPGDDVLSSLIFAWRIIKYVKSNAILLCRGTKTVGIGAGQMSRVDAAVNAVRKAGDMSKGAVLASDAFFPVPDSIEVAHEAGISAIIQPGGSIRDKEVIDACNKFGIPMVFTGMRHFRH